MGFLRRKQKSRRPEPEELYTNLRKHVLGTTPDNFREEIQGAPILALLWENGFAAGVGTLLGGVDGHVAMYLSNGGGTMGDWTSPALTEANTRWLEVGATFLPQLQATPDPPLPGDGVTQFGTRYCQDDGDPKSQWHPHAREEPSRHVRDTDECGEHKQTNNRHN